MKARKHLSLLVVLAALVLGCSGGAPKAGDAGEMVDARRLSAADANRESAPDADDSSTGLVDAFRADVDGGGAVGTHDVCDNGFDDDHDGIIDEDCNCAFGETQSCYSGSIATRGIGACRDGAEECHTEGLEFGVWPPTCTADVLPTDETCNAMDDDCDGAIDETCACTAGTMQPCGSPRWVSPCHQGTQTCAGDSTWSACVGAVAPSAEVCGDGVDNDCNGLVDDTCTCVPAPEVCGDGVDNDCDGTVDEGCACGAGGATCSHGRICCDGSCVEGAYDDSHCGRCDEACGGATTCSNGACCALPLGTACANVVDVSTGDNHACALDSGGNVLCWGWNDRGQLGVPGALNGSQPVRVAGLPSIAQVHAGSAHTCAVATTGTLYCWGANDLGEVGDASGTDRAAPVAVTLPGRVIDFALGSRHTCAVIEGGNVYCWGSDFGGEAGVSPVTASVLSPARVTSLTSVAQIGLGAEYTCARTTGGDVLCFGENLYHQLGVSTGGALSSAMPLHVTGAEPATALWVGGEDACVTMAGGTVQCWGNNAFGALGDGVSPPASHPTPTTIAPLAGSTAIRLGRNSTSFGCGLHADATVWCWGSNSQGQLGDGTVDDRPAPAPVPGLSNVVALDTGYEYACAVTRSHALYCWGMNTSKQLADGTQIVFATPQDVRGDFGGVELTAKGYHTALRTHSGAAWFWGSNFAGEAVDGSSFDRFTPTPLVGLGDILHLELGYQHGCAVVHDGTVECWGDDPMGQLGDGAAGGRRSIPMPAVGLSGVQSLALGNGDYSSGALLIDGQVSLWGETAAGTTATPTIAPGVADALAFAQLDGTACVITADHHVHCWGRNDFGQVGDGTMTMRPSPVEVLGIDDAIGLAAGEVHACVLRSDHAVSCWGYNNAGQLGDGTTMSRAMPVPVSGLSNIAAIRAGHLHTCAIDMTGAAYCWGSNFSGQLGDGTTVNRLVPTRVTALTDAMDLELGNEHTCALRTNGRVSCWGRNDQGQLGLGVCATTLRRLGPTPALCSAVP